MDIKKYFDFGFNYTIVFLLLITLIILPGVIFLPETWGYENGVIENFQMLILFIALFICFNVNSRKKLFIFAGLVLIILLLREVNCGRTLFFPIPGKVNMFYSWKDIPYGWLAHPIYGIYIASVFIYFFVRKVYLDLFQTIKTVKLPVYNFLFFILGIILSLCAEKMTNIFVFEELSELLLYSSLLSLIYLYSIRCKD